MSASTLDPALVEKARSFIDGDPDASTRRELEELIARGDAAELADRFGARLEFGTAGLRGLIGAGTNRMNRAVVIQTTAGLARWLVERVPGARERGVVVGRDGRRMSREFADDTACVLAAHGIRAHVFDDFAPTPLAAFAVGELGAAAGVMITASHNPPAYNGYKVYAENAAQIIPPADVEIAAAIAAVGPAREVPRLALDEARRAGLVVAVPDALVSRYVERAAAVALHPEARPAIKVVYTPLHGVGKRLALAALARAGIEGVSCVVEQGEPDGAFPTVEFPNPEEKGAMDLALALARRERADLVVANDPDADRLALAVPDGAGGFVQLTGNEVGVLLGHYVLTESSPDARRLVLASIVSSPMLGAIARALGVRYEETLTGFKWIANRALDLERAEGARFAFGYEEALGYSVGTLVRDKDGISAAVLAADLVSYLASRGTTALARLEAISREHGLYASAQKSHTRAGAAGLAAIAAFMRELRARPPARVGGHAVVATSDYLARERRTSDGACSLLALPPSDVVAFELASGGRVIARPSGTEPKLKIYFDHREIVGAGEPLADARARAAAALRAMAEDFPAPTG